jgi:hypothetical protein
LFLGCHWLPQDSQALIVIDGTVSLVSKKILEHRQESIKFINVLKDSSDKFICIRKANGVG